MKLNRTAFAYISKANILIYGWRAGVQIWSMQKSWPIWHKVLKRRSAVCGTKPLRVLLPPNNTIPDKKKKKTEKVNTQAMTIYTALSGWLYPTYLWLYQVSYRTYFLFSDLFIAAHAINVCVRSWVMKLWEDELKRGIEGSIIKYLLSKDLGNIGRGCSSFQCHWECLTLWTCTLLEAVCTAAQWN